MQVQEQTTAPETAQLLADAIENTDSGAIAALLSPLPRSEALREVLNLSIPQRDAAFGLMPIELAS